MEKKINNKKTIILGIGLLLVSLIGLSLAGVLEYYGKISANINVNPPVFYPDSSMYDSNQFYRVLKINEIGSGTISLNSGSSIYFATENLLTGSWYPSKWTIKLKVSYEGEGTINFNVIKMNQKLGFTGQICSTSSTLNQNNGNIINLEMECTNSNPVNFNNERLALKLELTGIRLSNFNIYLGQDIRLEVQPLS